MLLMGCKLPGRARGSPEIGLWSVIGSDEIVSEKRRGGKKVKFGRVSS